MIEPTASRSAAPPAPSRFLREARKLDPDGSAPVEVRDRLWTLLATRYERLWAVGAYVFGHAVDQHCPRALRAGCGAALIGRPATGVALPDLAAAWLLRPGALSDDAASGAFGEPAFVAVGRGPRRPARRGGGPPRRGGALRLRAHARDDLERLGPALVPRLKDEVATRMPASLSLIGAADLSDPGKIVRVTALPGNDFVLKQLRDLVASGQAIAFVGAGASAGLYPLWNGLIANLAQQAVDRGFATEADRDFWLKSKPQQAVRGIKQALGDSVYGHILRDIFRPKAGPDGNRFTRVHAALVRLPFRGLATTNYDPGLIEARLALRPDVIGTGYATWKDADPVQRWLTGEAFEPGALPILFAHGVYERGDTIVLGAAEYREAYRSGGFRRLFDKLWGQDRLVFVGFGFSDPWLDFLADDVVTQTAAQAAGEPRHIALVGLDEKEPYTPESRRLFHDQYNAAVYFYRVGRSADGAPDHAELVRLLEGLVEGTAPKA